VLHDFEGGSAGVTVNLYARALGLTPLGVPRVAYDSMHGIQDMVMAPKPTDGAREQWRGRALPPDSRPALVVFHANEVAQAFPGIDASGVFRLVQDPHDPWPFPGPMLHADPIGPEEPLVPAVWPAGLVPSAEPWERELAELMFVTWQPFLREALASTEAAYSAGPVAALLAAQDCIPHMRCRVLACHRLGIPTFLLQHGADLGNRAGGKGDRTHYFADRSLVWSRAAGRDLRARGVRGETLVVGWPQAVTDHARSSRERGRAVPKADRPWVILTSGTASDNAEVHYDTAELYLREALQAVRATAPEARIVVKCHPFHDRIEAIAGLCARLGISNADVVSSRDPWEVVATARGVIAPKSTSALCAHALAVPLVIYYPFEDDAWYDRFADVPVARTRHELRAALEGAPPASRGVEAVGSQYRADVQPAARIVAAIRREIRRRGHQCVRPRQAA
jgi:hypothetical protein